MSNNLVDRVRERLDANDNNGVLALLPSGWHAGLKPSERALIHHARGIAAFKLDDILGARFDLEASYSLLAEVPSPVDRLWILNGYAAALGQMGDHEGAASLLTQAFMDLTPSGPQEGYFLWNWGWQSFKAGKHTHGLDLLSRSCNVLEQVGTKDLVGAILDLATCLLEVNEAEKASEALERAIRVASTCPPLWKGRYDRMRAQAAFVQERLSDALALALSAFKWADAAGSAEEKSQASLLAARVVKTMGMPWSSLADQALDEGLRAKNGALIKSAIDMYGEEVSE